MVDEVEFFDGESGRMPFSDKASFRNIVMNTVMRLGFYFAVEFRGGYWEESPQGRKYFPNTRAVVDNEIEYLWILLEPHFDEDVIKEAGEAYAQAREYKRERTPENASDAEVKLWDNEASLRYSKDRLRIISKWLKENSYLEGKAGADSI